MELESIVINKFRSGDKAAFEDIFNAYYRALTMYANTILKDMDDAEDIVQQVFVSMWEKRLVLDIHTSFRAMLYKSVHNACLNRIKQQQVRSTHAKEVQLYAEIATSYEEMQKNELQNKIDDALNVLPEQCAKIFKLSRFEQLKYQEIANQLGLSVKTIENQMGKALKIMREQLKDYLPILLIILSHYYFE